MPNSNFRIGNKVTIDDPELDLHPNTVGTVVGHMKQGGWPILYIPGIPFGKDFRYPVDPQYLTRVPRIPRGGIRVRRTGPSWAGIKKGAEAVVESIDPRGYKLEGYKGWYSPNLFEIIL